MCIRDRSGGEQQAGDDRKHQDRGIGDPGAKFVQQHADEHAGWNGEGHVANGHGADLTHGQSEIRFHGGGQWGKVEPDDKRQEKSDPSEMECSVSPLERPKIAKHWDKCWYALERRKKAAEVKLDGAEQKDRLQELVNASAMPSTVLSATKTQATVPIEH